MAFTKTRTKTAHGWRFVIVETDAGPGTEIGPFVVPTSFDLVAASFDLTSGDGTTLNPEIGRVAGWVPSSGDEIAVGIGDAPSAGVVLDVVVTGVTPTRALWIRNNVDAGTNNVIEIALEVQESQASAGAVSLGRVQSMIDVAIADRPTVVEVDASIQVATDAIDVALTDYATTSAVTATLADYATTSAVNASIASQAQLLPAAPIPLTAASTVTVPVVDNQVYTLTVGTQNPCVVTPSGGTPGMCSVVDIDATGAGVLTVAESVTLVGQALPTGVLYRATIFCRATGIYDVIPGTLPA